MGGGHLSENGLVDIDGENGGMNKLDTQVAKKAVRKSIKKQLWVKRQGVWITKIDLVLFVVILSIILFLWNSQASMPSWEN